MDYRSVLVPAVLAAAFAGAVVPSRAETVATDSGIAVKESDVATPRRGMTMEQVASKFGSPVSKVPAVGKPPISRWEYPGFIVYFEHEHVIHSVVAEAPAAGEAAAAPAAAAPAAADAAAPAASAAAAADATSSN